MAPKIVLHHLVASRSVRIVWLLEELVLPYDVVVHLRTSMGNAGPSLKKISSLGKAPVLELENEILIESANIMNRLISYAQKTGLKNGNVQLDLTDDDVFWTSFAEGSLTNYFQHSLILFGAATVWEKGMVKASQGSDAEVRKEAVSFAKWVNRDIHEPHIRRSLGEMDQFLLKHSYFSGTEQPGLGDFMMLSPLSTVIPANLQRQRQGKPSKFQIGAGLEKWWARVGEREGFKRAVRRLEEEESKVGHRAKL